MKTAIIALAAFTATGAAAAPGVVPPKFNPRAPANVQGLPSCNYGSVETVLTGIGARHQRAGQAGKPALLVTVHGACQLRPCRLCGSGGKLGCRATSRPPKVKRPLRMRLQ